MINDLNKRFKYRADPSKRDVWRFMSRTDPVIYGDCEDYSLYIARELSGGSLKRFWFNLLIGKFEFWYVGAGGDLDKGHCVLVQGDQAIDNWTRKWVSLGEMRQMHKFVSRYRFPVVLYKVLF